MRSIVAWLLLLAASLASAETVTDLAGRSVALPANAQRIVLGEGRVIAALAILERDPTRRVVGMMGEFERYDPAGYAQYRSALPAIERIARVGRSTGSSFSLEAALALAPDLAIFSLEGHGPTPKDKELIAQLEKAGVPVLFVDFRKEPLLNTPRSITLLGAALGKRAEAAAFTAFYQGELRRVTERLPPAGTPAPRVFIENRVGLGSECCATMANGMMGRFIDFAGGNNIASPLIPGSFGTLSLEWLLRNPPDVYIGTAIGQSGGEPVAGRIVLGAGASSEVARESLRQALQRTGIAELTAVRSGRAYAIWHHFYNSPFNVAAVQAMAKWLHPQRFADLDPEATLRTAYARFQPMPLNGTYWIGLK